MDMEPMPDIEDMSDIAVEVALDAAMSMEDDDMCDISMLAGERLLGCKSRIGGTARAFQRTSERTSKSNSRGYKKIKP